MANNLSVQPNPFWAFEHAAWERSARPYHNFWTRLTIQAVEPLLSTVQIRGGMHLLDVATGQGNVAQAAAQRGAHVVGVDFSEAMLAEARKQYPDIAFCTGDAEALPFSNGCFDAVVINFGLLHFGRPEQALAEARRVLRCGGKIGFTVWTLPKAAIGFQIILEAIETHGNPNVPLPPGPPFFRFSEPAESQRTLLEVGFANLQIVEIAQLWQLDSPDELFAAFYEATARTGGLLRAQSSEALRAVRTVVSRAARVYEKGGRVSIPMPAILASAIKP